MAHNAFVNQTANRKSSGSDNNSRHGLHIAQLEPCERQCSFDQQIARDPFVEPTTSTEDPGSSATTIDPRIQPVGCRLVSAHPQSHLVHEQPLFASTEDYYAIFQTVPSVGEDATVDQPMGVIRKKTAARGTEGGTKYHCDVCSVDVTSTVSPDPIREFRQAF